MKRARPILIWAVVLAVCLAASVLNLRVSLNRKAAALDRAFVSQSGDLGPGVHLDRVDEYSAYLVKLGLKYDLPQTAAVEEARQTLAQAGDNRARYQAFAALRQAAQTLAEALPQAALSSRDLGYVEKYGALLTTEAERCVYTAQDYNRQVEAYQKLLSAFPAGLLRRLAGVREIEVFG